MLTEIEARDAMGKNLYDNDGDKVGKIAQVYLDDTTGGAEFLTVNTGLFGGNESFVPAGQATMRDDGLTVPFSKDKIKDAPNVAADGHLDPAAENELYAYYGMSGAQTDTTTDTTTGPATYAASDAAYTTAGADDYVAASDTDISSHEREDLAERPGVEGQDTSGPTTDDAMTRSEEQLHVGTTTQQAGKARLRKYVTTEEQTVTVPVSKEYAVLESEPITEENAGSALEGGDITSEEHEVLLNEEVVNVEKTVKPVERVRLGTETRTEDQTVTEEVRKENVEVEGDVEDHRV